MAAAMSADTATALERVEVPVGDGTVMAAHIAWPAKKTKNPPGIIVGQDAFGVTTFLHDVGRRFAELGCVAILPELYHRSGDDMVVSYDDREMSGCKPLQDAMTPEGMIADGVAAYRWLAEHDSPTERIAAMGFCMGGRLSYLTNAHVPLKAAISLYGRIQPAIYPYAARQHGEVMMMWGGRDHGSRPNTIGRSRTPSPRAARSTHRSSSRTRRTRSSATFGRGRTTPRHRAKPGR